MQFLKRVFVVLSFMFFSLSCLVLANEPTRYLTESEPYVYMVEEGNIVYEGVDKEDANKWKIRTVPYGELKVEGNLASEKSIAVLVYPGFASSSFGIKFELDRMNWVNGYGKRIDRRDKDFRFGIFNDFGEDRPLLSYRYMHSPKETLAKTYGYSIGYDLKSSRYSINFSSGVDEKYSEEKNPEKRNEDEEKTLSRFNLDMQDYQNNVTYWRDLSPNIASLLCDYFKKSGYKVLDLTPAKNEFRGMTPSEISSNIARDHDVHKIIIVPYEIQSKWTSQGWQSIITAIGLHFNYKAFLFENGESKPSFSFDDVIDPVDIIAANLGSSRIKFFAKKENILKDGVLDDEWMTDKLLSKFSGYESGLKEKIKIGGKLFEKLHEKGY